MGAIIQSMGGDRDKSHLWYNMPYHNLMYINNLSNINQELEPQVLWLNKHKSAM